MNAPSESRLAAALRVLLRPLVRLVLRRGMAFGEMAEILKRAYVDVASTELAVPGRRPTISRIAVLTGLTRKEAARLVEEARLGSTDVGRRKINRAARVLSGWIQDSDFADGRGGPASLPFEAERGPSITELVRRHGADVPARAALDELVRVGAVRQLKDGRYRPVERAYVPHGAVDEKLAILGTDVADLISAIDHNLEDAQSTPFYQRKVAYDALPPEYLPELRRRVDVEAQKLLEQLDREMSEHDRDVVPGSSPGSHRAMVGIYYYEEANDDADESN